MKIIKAGGKTSYSLGSRIINISADLDPPIFSK